MNESRTMYTIKNVKTGVLVQIIKILMTFIVRTIFIKCLNEEYLGVSGLFTNILTILSFAEMGIGTAIIFNMYEPIATNNKEKVKSLMKLYKTTYNFIGILVFFIGILVIPFLNYIVGDIPNITENIRYIYFLYLLNTSMSYFFTYKRSIISSHQKQSVINNIDTLFYIFKSLAEILILVFTRNFILYLIIQIICTFIENIFISIKANSMYPYIKEKEIEKLSKEESKNIFLNIKNLIVYKFGSMIMKGTDNIIISSMINVGIVGLCSNYIILINAIKGIISSAVNGLTASIGNLNAGNDIEKKENIFYNLTFINYMLYSFCSVALVILLNPFIHLWLGNNYVLNISVSFALSLSFFIEGLRNPGYLYRTTLGLFQKAKSTPYIAAITNIILSIILCKKWGVVGVFIATSISQLVSYCWIDPYLIHKYEFKTSVIKYYKKFILYLLSYFLILVITIILTNFIPYKGFLEFGIKCFMVLIVTNFMNVLLFCKTNDYKLLIDRLKNILKIKSKV